MRVIGTHNDTVNESVVYEAKILQFLGKLEASPEKIHQLWENASRHEVFATDELTNLVDFTNLLLDPLTVWIEISSGDTPCGVVHVNHIVPGFDCDCQFVIWDGRARGKEGIAKKVLDFLFTTFNLNRITYPIPIYQRGAIRFAERIGFRQEGIKRNAAARRGQLVHVVIMGVLR